MPIDPFRAIVVPAPSKNDEAADASKIQASLTNASIEDLNDEEVLVRIEYSSINYKDVLAVQAHPGVAKNLPIIAGITASGTVVESSNDEFKPGDNVFVAHAKFGTAADGGFADYCRVPADWLFHVPENMTTESVSAWGTAGFTAAQSVDKLGATKRQTRKWPRHCFRRNRRRGDFLRDAAAQTGLRSRRDHRQS